MYARWPAPARRDKRSAVERSIVESAVLCLSSLGVVESVESSVEEARAKGEAGPVRYMPSFEAAALAWSCMTVFVRMSG